MVDSNNMDERLERSFSLVYYQVLGELGITACSRWSDIYVSSCGLVCMHAYSLIIAG